MKTICLSFLLFGFAFLGSSLNAEVLEITKSVSDDDKKKITEAAPSSAPVKPAHERKVLVFSLTKGFRHSSIPHGVVAMDALGKKSGAFSIEHSEDPKVFAADNLKRFDAVMMLNTTGDLWAEEDYKRALVDFVKSGKGLIGIHSATDTFYGWPEYGIMMGAYFDGHPWHEKVNIKIEDPEHATCKCFEGSHFEKVDEIYQYKENPYSRERLRILMSLDPVGTDFNKGGMNRKDNDYAVGWVQSYGDGRVFYCNLGHREDTYWDKKVLEHFLAGIQFALGDLEADTTPSARLPQPPMPAVLEKGDRLAIIGDSITEQKLYSKYIEAYILACMPHLDIQCLQFGWSGERAPGFASRMENDLVPWKPDVVTTCYGMNDGSYRKYEPGIGKTYENGMRQIVDRMKKAGATVVVGSPGVVDSDTFARDRPDFSEVYNENLGELRNIARQLAHEHGFNFADVYGSMMSAMEKSKSILGKDYHVGGGDGVHPAENGQLAMAYAFLRGLGFDGNLGTITVNAKTKQADANGGHTILASNNGTVRIQSIRYPFCFYGENEKPNSTRSILPYLPFNRDLNRLTLVVTDLEAENAEVKWGDLAKTFTRKQLAKGVNLAAEFMDNPLSSAFRTVMDAVAKKQGYETPMIKSHINKFRFYSETFKDDSDVKNALYVLRDKLQDRDDELYVEAKATVQPVQHEITITAK